jgi:hypothetical protein
MYLLYYKTGFKSSVFNGFIAVQQTLIRNEFVVRVATHNSRLLNIMKVNLEDIIFFNAHSQFCIPMSKVKELFCEASDEIEIIRKAGGISVDASIKYKLDLSSKQLAYESFLEQNLQSEEFYRCLFYNEIIITEGNSDIVALSAMKHEFDNSLEIYNPNGKAFIPFFTKLFLEFRKKVTIIIDADNSISIEGTPLALTLLCNRRR